MKTLSAFLLLVGLAGCSYPSENYESRAEAEKACSEWESQEKELINIEHIKEETASWVHLSSVNENNVITSRYCKDVLDASQFVGYENKAIQDGVWEEKKGKKGQWKIVKRFNY